MRYFDRIAEGIANKKIFNEKSFINSIQLNLQYFIFFNI